MSLEEILKVKKEIMDMIYNVGWIFLATPILIQGGHWIVGMLLIWAGVPGRLINTFGSINTVPSSVIMSGFVTMIYMTYKMMDLKDMSLVSLVRLLVKVILLLII